jgi:hypothetical protein
MPTSEFDNTSPSDTDYVLGPTSPIVNQVHAPSRVPIDGAKALREYVRGEIACLTCRGKKSRCKNAGIGTQCDYCYKFNRKCVYEAAASTFKIERRFQVSCRVQS